MDSFETDYLIIGAGAAGMAFADTLITESDAEVTIVDRRGQPGGHWNDAYGFVTLHQPSAFYGVNSMELGSGRKDVQGTNAGMHELASGAEVAGYFQRVMSLRLLASGRVRFLPMTQHHGAGEIESLLSGRRSRVHVRRKTVDAAYLSPSVPATHRRRFSIAPGVRCVPPGELPRLAADAGDGAALPHRFVVLGAGKTAMDTLTWLLGADVDPQAIQWVVPRDSWLINRVTTQPGDEFFDSSIGNQAAQMQALAEARSVEDLFLRLEACGALLRIDPQRWPSMFHLATVTAAEVDQLRRITDVVRLGRVQALQPERMQLDEGEVAVAPGTLFVDCTASAVEPRALQPVFQGKRIVLQMVRLPQPCFSAALTAYVEVHRDSDSEKNRLCAAVPFPHQLADYPRAMAVNLGNQAQWAQDKPLRQWIRDSRLDFFGRLIAAIAPEDAGRLATLARLRQNVAAAMVNLPRLIASA